MHLQYKPESPCQRRLPVRSLTVDMTNGNTKPKVLVADDEQVIANTLAIILNQAGFEARAVYSGENALETVDAFQPNMLISDVIMTGMTGIEAAIQIRQKLPQCKVLLFSGQAATADLLEKARAQGHEFEILAKPVHPTDLLAKLRS
jgi:CheY-like chemotaxis protein